MWYISALLHVPFWTYCWMCRIRVRQNLASGTLESFIESLWPQKSWSIKVNNNNAFFFLISKRMFKVKKKIDPTYTIALCYTWSLWNVSCNLNVQTNAGLYIYYFLSLNFKHDPFQVLLQLPSFLVGIHRIKTMDVYYEVVYGSPCGRHEKIQMFVNSSLISSKKNWF